MATDLIQSLESDSGEGIDLTALTKLKHAALWTAAKKCGGQSGLARRLGVHASALGEWVNLQRCPPNGPNEHWSIERFAKLESELFDLTGQSIDELFPPQLRAIVRARDGRRFIEEKTARVDMLLLANYAVATRERLIQQNRIGESDVGELRRERLEESFSCLTARERAVVKYCIGMDDGEYKTFQECGAAFKVTSTRVNQIYHKAIGKLRRYAQSHWGDSWTEDLRFE